VGSYDGKLYAIDVDSGAFVWSYETGDMVVSSPAVANNAVYVGSYNHVIYAFGSSSPANQPADYTSTIILIAALLALTVAEVIWQVRIHYRKKCRT